MQEEQRRAAGSAKIANTVRPILQPHLPGDHTILKVIRSCTQLAGISRAESKNLYFTRSAAQLRHTQRVKQFVRKRRTSACFGAQQDNVRAVLPQRLPMLLKPGSDDDAVAECLEAIAVLGTGRPGDDLPGMNAESQPKALAVLRIRAARSPQGARRDLLRREAGLRGVVRPGNARREQG